MAPEALADGEPVADPLLLGAATRFLAPWCERIQLHLTQAIRLKPGQPAQMIHRDRWAWGKNLSHQDRHTVMCPANKSDILPTYRTRIRHINIPVLAEAVS
jgi:hypothetical protein